MSNFMLNPNADIYQLLAQQNQPRGGWGGGGGGVSYDPNADLSLQRNLLDLELGGLERRLNIENRAGMQARMQDLGMAPIEARQARKLDQQAFEQSLRQQQQGFLTLQKLQLQLASASGPEAEALDAQLRAKEEEVRRLSNAIERGKAAMAETNPQLQSELATARSSLETMLTAKNNRLSLLRGEGGANLTSAIAATMARLQTSPSAYGAAPISPLKGLGVGIGRLAESALETITGDRTADQLLQAAELKPELYAAARRFGNGVLASALPRTGLGSVGGPGLVGAVGDYMMGIEPGDDTAQSNAFVSDVLTNIATDVLSGEPSGGIRDRAGATQNLKTLFNELASVTAVPNQDPQVVSSKIVPLLQAAAESVYGDRNAAADLADALDATLMSAGTLGAEEAAKIDPQGDIGVQQVQGAAMAYAMERSRAIRAALNAATTGQMPRMADLERMRGIFSDELRVGGAYQLPAMLQEIQAQDLEPIIRMLGGRVAGGLGRATQLGRQLQDLIASEAQMTGQMRGAEEALADLERPSAARRGRVSSAQLAEIERLLSGLQ